MKSSRTKRRQIKNEIDVILGQQLLYNLPHEPSQPKEISFSKSCNLHRQSSINFSNTYQLPESSKDPSVLNKTIFNDFPTSVSNCQDNNDVSSSICCPDNSILSNPVYDQGNNFQDIRTFLGRLMYMV